MTNHPEGLIDILVVGLAVIAFATLGRQAWVAAEDPGRNAVTRLLDWWLSLFYRRIFGERASIVLVYLSVTCYLGAALAFLVLARELVRYAALDAY